MRSVFDGKIHRVPALRAIFKMLAEPRTWAVGGGCAWRWCMKILVVNLKFDTWTRANHIYINLIWHVETAFFNKAVLSNIVLLPVANFDQTWLVTIHTFGSVFWFVLESLSFVFNFLLSSRSCEHMDSDSELESFQNIYLKSYARFKFWTVVMKLTNLA